MANKVYECTVEPFVPPTRALVALSERDIFACAQAQREARCPVESIQLARLPFRFQWQGRWCLPDGTEVYLISDLESERTQMLQMGERCGDYVVDRTGDHLVLKGQNLESVTLHLHENTLTDVWRVNLAIADGTHLTCDSVPTTVTLQGEVWQVSAVDTRRQSVTFTSPKGRLFELCAQP